jgi:glycosyltransferase involved in cell wall biosynthesis
MVTLPALPGAAEGGPKRALFLHVFPSFAIGGVPVRMVGVMNYFGKRFKHAIIALDGNFDAGSRFAHDIDPTPLPMRHAKGNALRGLFNSSRMLRRLCPDLLITYNWGAIEWAMANRLLSICPHVHLEDGFGCEEADRQLRRRVLFRRWALARCDRLVVPSRQLEAIAETVWKIPASRIVYIPNGVDPARFADVSRVAAPGFVRRPGEIVVGTVAPLRPEKNIGRLLRAFAALDAPAPTRLVIAGAGGERERLERLACEIGIGDRVDFVGQKLPEQVLGALDIFALSSDTEQMPIALLEAMAAGRPVIAVDVGDVREMLCEANREFVVPRDAPGALTAALAQLARDPARQQAIGRMNRERAVVAFPQQRMFAAYEQVFALARRR